MQPLSNTIPEFIRLHCLAVVLAVVLTVAGRVDGLEYKSLAALPPGTQPSGSLVLAADGFLYGVAAPYGANNSGALFCVSPSGEIKVLHTFNGISYNPEPNWGGCQPSGTPIVAEDGSVFGLTRFGGAYGYGTVFRYDPAGGFTTLHDFRPETGINASRILLARSGILYGIAYDGGPMGGGTLFQITPDAQFSVVHALGPGFDQWTAQTGDIAAPLNPSAIIETQDGTIVGATYCGGPIQYREARNVGRRIIPGLYYSNGTIFKWQPRGELRVVHQFDDATAGPNSLVEGIDGSIYGTNDRSLGTVFRLGVQEDFSIVHRFAVGPNGGYSDGEWPRGLVSTREGNLMGFTLYGGANGAGTLFQVSSRGVFETLHSFTQEEAESGHGEVVEASNGYFYGVTKLPDRLPELITEPEVPPEVAGVANVERQVVRAAVRPRPRFFRMGLGTQPAENSQPLVRGEECILRKFPAKVTVPVLANDRDPDRDALKVKAVSSVENGTASVTPDGRKIVLSIESLLAPSQIVNYRVTDGHGGEAVGQLVLRAPLGGRYKAASLVDSGSGTNIEGAFSLEMNRRGEFRASLRAGNLTYKGRGSFGTGDQTTLPLRSCTGKAVVVRLGLQVTAGAKVEGIVNINGKDLSFVSRKNP